MAMSAVGMCSAALLKLGATPIQALTDSTVEATVAAALYPIVRDALLTAHPWTFTIAQAVLQASASEASAGYSYVFPLPFGCLRVLAAGAGRSGRGLDYRVRGNHLLADTAPLTVTYQQRVDEAVLPPFFVNALVARLAAEFCLPLTENGTRAEGLLDLAAAELRLARLLDSQQSPPQRVEDFTLVSVRDA